MDSMMAHPFGVGETAYAPIGADESRRLLIELPFGMFKQHRWLPLHILSQLVVELTLGPANYAFSDTTASWSLPDVALLCTCLHVDGSATAQHHQHIDSSHKTCDPVPVGRRFKAHCEPT